MRGTYGAGCGRTGGAQTGGTVVTGTVSGEMGKEEEERLKKSGEEGHIPKGMASAHHIGRVFYCQAAI